MYLRIQNEGARREELAQDQEDDYVVYHLWPSLSNRGNSPGDPPSSHLYPVDYDPALSSEPPSPITFAPTVVPVEMAVDFGSGATLPEVSDAGAEVQKENPLAKYSPIFKMGLFLSQMNRRFDRAVEGVKLKLKLRKPKVSEP